MQLNDKTVPRVFKLLLSIREVSKVHRSLFIAGGGAEDFRGITWFLGKQKGGSVVTENPKGGSLKTLEGFREGDQSNLLGKLRHGGGGSRKSSKLLGGSLQWSNRQRGNRLNFTLFSRKCSAKASAKRARSALPGCLCLALLIRLPLASARLKNWNNAKKYHRLCRLQGRVVQSSVKITQG